MLRRSGEFAVLMGRFDAGVAAARRAVVLDPLGRGSHLVLGRALYLAHRYQEALAALAETISLDPDFKQTYAHRGLSFYALGDLEQARAACETKPDYWESGQCLAIVYDKLGRHDKAQALMAIPQATQDESAAYQYATVYAQWGDRTAALKWLETAWRLRDPGLTNLKTDPLMDPLRQEPRFRAIETALKFPD